MDEKRLKFTREQREKYPQESFIHPSVEIPEWVKIGKNVTIHENCIIGSEGFGYEKDENGKLLHPYFENVRNDMSVQITAADQQGRK